MNKLYEKNEPLFAVTWIMLFVFFYSFSEAASKFMGIEKLITAPFCILFLFVLLRWIKVNNLYGKYGLCNYSGSAKQYLYFLPLVLIASVNLWNGIILKFSLIETSLYVVSMICVGFIEELIFRGLLFKALIKKGITFAIIISSITFGLGHIVNLIGGAELFSTLLQIFYATALGFLFTILVYKPGSLIPAIITHSIINGTSAFSSDISEETNMSISAILIVVSVAYSIYIINSNKISHGKTII